MTFPKSDQSTYNKNAVPTMEMGADVEIDVAQKVIKKKVVYPKCYLDDVYLLCQIDDEYKS